MLKGDKTMRSFARIMCTAAACICGLGNSVAANAASTFTFRFDSQGLPPSDGPLLPPIVGTGTFDAGTDLSPGTYDLTSLPGFSLHFQFLDGSSFDTPAIVTPLTGAAVRITDIGGGIERLFFTEGSGAGQDGGPFSGALDLENGSSLSFEPSFFGGNFLYIKAPFAGRYEALSSWAPEPASWAMMLGGFGMIGGAMRARRKAALSFA